MAEEVANFSEAREHLEEIVKQVRSKDVSLEKSLDLFEEAIKVGNSAFELIDRADFSAEELNEEGADGKEDSVEGATDEENATVSQQGEDESEPLGTAGDNEGGSDENAPANVEDNASSE